MIKIFLKHQILEFCIDQIFSRLIEQFSSCGKRDIIKDSYFKKIIFRTYNGDCKYLHTYYGVSVLSDPFIKWKWGEKVEWAVKIHAQRGDTKQACSKSTKYYEETEGVTDMLIGAVDFYE